MRRSAESKEWQKTVTARSSQKPASLEWTSVSIKKAWMMLWSLRVSRSSDVKWADGFELAEDAEEFSSFSFRPIKAHRMRTMRVLLKLFRSAVSVDLTGVRLSRPLRPTGC